MSQHFQIALVERIVSPELISLLRRALHQPVMSLKQKIEAGAPILDVTPDYSVFGEFIESVTALLHDLDSLGVGYAVTIDGRPRSVQYLRNVFARWHKIGRDLQAYDDKIANEGD